MVIRISEEFNISVDNLLKGDKDIVHGISNDTRVRKKNRIVIKVFAVLLVILALVTIYSLFKVKDVTQSSIVSAERNENQVVITLKRSVFYKDVAYDIIKDDSDTVVYIKIDRILSPFSSNNNVIEINPIFLKNTTGVA